MEKRYDHLTCENNAQQKWETEQTYAIKKHTKQVYSIDTPPPTVSGKLHIGHIFSYTQTDILARYKRMSGHAVFYPFGFDDNGLPTERYVEKKCNIKGYEMSRSDFIALCIKESHLAAHEFKQLWQKMGLSIDWNLVYSTISDSSRKLSQQSFIELFQKGYIYRKQEPALYCTTCRTSVAQAELDDKEFTSSFNDIIFKDSDGNDLIISTTRPELLPACVAVLYNSNDVRYKKLYKKTATVPLFNQSVPILPDELVDPNKGSGLVMVCTFGDKTDVIWYKKHNLPYIQVIGLNGKCTDNAQFLEGMNVANARTTVIDTLREKNLLASQKIISHSVGIHERCKKEIEIIVLPQWFISILPYKQRFLEMADHINWYPDFMKTRYIDWVQNLSWDWGISRQRFYGIPFPAWHCQTCGEILLANIDDLPIDPQEKKYPEKCPQCNSSDIVPDTDVMDTWNTSSLTPYICQELYRSHILQESSQTISPFDLNISKEYSFIPMNMRPQAHDIIRTWAFDTIVKTWMHNNTIPWTKIIISGHVLSDKKEKISKKEGNGMEPDQLLAKYPADAIRYWTASGKLGHDISFSEEQIVIGQKLITKLWNAFRFAHPHLETFTTPTKLPETLSAVNEWLLHTVSLCFEKYCYYFEQQEFSLALTTIDQFFWNDFCDNYIELIKNQLFNPHEYSENEIYATKWILYHVGLRILQLYAPYIPHITETLYSQLYQAHETVASIHQTQFNTIQIPYNFTQQAAVIKTIISLVSTVRKLKTEQQLSLKTSLEKLHICVDNPDLINSLKNHDQLIRGVTQAIAIHYEINKNIESHLMQKNDAWHAHIKVAS